MRTEGRPRSLPRVSTRIAVAEADLVSVKWRTLFSEDELDELREGGRVDLAGGLYSVCWKCRCVVKLNKTFFGGLHLCKNKYDGPPLEPLEEARELLEKIRDGRT